MPFGVIVAAAMAAAVSLWNDRRTPYGDLESLIAIAKDWPDSVAGRDDIEAAIEVQLARVRRANGIANPSSASRRAERAMRAGSRWIVLRFLGTFLVLWVFSVAYAYSIGRTGWDGRIEPPWFFWTLMALTVISTVALMSEIAALFSGSSAVRMLAGFLRTHRGR
ncbi:hypothetical protein [Nocardia sp. NPDC051832]|uniref:hypothetical protein n=1 Tax=Nocardia sp. NPDC051832 TaxID=3155673 RepID=UPI00344678B6